MAHFVQCDVLNRNLYLCCLVLLSKTAQITINRLFLSFFNKILVFCYFSYRQSSTRPTDKRLKRKQKEHRQQRVTSVNHQINLINSISYITIMLWPFLLPTIFILLALPLISFTYFSMFLYSLSIKIKMTFMFR